MLIVHMEDTIHQRRHTVSGYSLLTKAQSLLNDIFDIPTRNVVANHHQIQTHKSLELSLTCYTGLHKVKTISSVCLNDPVFSAVIQ